MEYLFLTLALLLTAAIGGLLYQQIPIWAIRPRAPGITLDSMIGFATQREVMQKIIRELMAPDFHARSLTRSVLIYGRSGFSKRTLARAAAGFGQELGALKFYEIDCSSLLHNDEAECAIRNLLKVATKNHEPTIVLMHGLEAILGEPDLIHFIRKMVEGLRGDSHRVILIGCASCDNDDRVTEELDMFEFRLKMWPDLYTRDSIVRSWIDQGNATDCDIKALCEELHGCSYSEIISTLDRASHHAKQTATRSSFNESDFVQALYFKHSVLDSTVDGPQNLRAAYHEAGHAIVAEFLSGIGILRISAIPTQDRNGFARPRLVEEGALQDKHQFWSYIVATLGGVAAEFVAYDGNIGAGSKEDINLARHMVIDYIERGFDEMLTGVAPGDVEALVQEAFNEAVSIITDRQQLLEDLVKILSQNCSLNGDEVREVLFADLHMFPSKEEVDELFGEDDFDPDTYMID